jgi:hypothetical protein
MVNQFKMKLVFKYFLATGLLLSFCAAPLRAQELIITDPTANKGKIEWQWRAQVGEVPQNKPVTTEFKFKNISNLPVTITDVQAGCKCTVTSFPKEPILAGEEGSIKITYDAKRLGQFYRPISVTTSFDPESAVMLAFLGTVVKN